VLVRSLVSRTTPAVLDGFSPQQFATATAQLGTGRRYTALVPTQLVRLLDADVDLSTYDAILVGGGPAPVNLLDSARAAGGRVVATYGMTETCGGCVYDGYPLDGVRVEIADNGRIRVTGPVLARGYRFGRAFTVDGWFQTADLGRTDDAGRLEVLGRADDVIVTGGMHVVPQTVEAVLAGHPAVRAAGVVGRPDGQWGERVVAVVVPRGPGSPRQLAELRDYVAKRAGQAAAPKELVLVHKLPLLDSGKLDRAALRLELTLPRSPEPR
jgi:O-succinylbenzoic acid--CoA ligase